MRATSAALRRRISRSLVTVLVLTFIQTFSGPLLNFHTPQAEAAVTQGTIVNSSTIYGNQLGGGTVNNKTPCASGAITGLVASSETANVYSEGFGYICTDFNLNGTLSGTSVTTKVFEYQTINLSQSCPAGQVGIGIKTKVAANMVQTWGLVCGNPMSQANSSTLAFLPNTFTGGTDATFTCSPGMVLVGFNTRTGNGMDQMIPRCAPYSGFVYAAVGAPTIDSSGPHTATVSFAAVTTNNADTPETYTVTAVSSLGTTETATGMSSPITISNLRSNVSYTITVTGLNNYGTSAATSSASLSLAPLPGSDTDTALDLNGSSQYAWAADTGAGGLFDISGAITMEAWVYPTQSTAGVQYSVICKSESYQLFHIDGVWKYSLWGTSSWLNGVSTTIPVELNEWHHIALTRAASSSVANFYYDGVLVKSDGGTQTVGTGNIADNSFPFGIGGMIYGGPTLQYGFKGKIDHVAIFDTARDSATVLSDMHSYISTSTSGLRLYYDMNEGSGSTLYNRTSGALKASDLALIASPTFPDVKEESTSGSYNVVKFPRSYLTSNNGWKVPAGASSASVFIVAGGGGGGSRVGGGGGAGGLLFQSSITLSTGTIEKVTIGQGGIGAKNGNLAEINYQGVSGQNSIFGSRYTLIGGGGGGGYNTVDNSYHAGKSGGSGGGAAPNFSAGSWPAGAGATLQFSTYGYGIGYAGGSGYNAAGYPGGGGGGSAGAAANLTSNTVAGAGGAATLDPILGTTTCYAGGGGGGVGDLFSGSAGSGGTCAGGTSTAGNGGKNNTVSGSSATVNSGSGGGGSGYNAGTANTTDKPGGNGGSGVIIIKFVLSTTKPIFTGPVNDTTTAGLTETFTVTGSANAPMVRSYLWQVSTDTGTSWSTPTQGSGWLTASYTTPVLTTSMSGTRYQYRVVVTDTDTAGFLISDTSTHVYLIINPALQVTGNSTVYKAINVVKYETFTVAGGTASHRYSLTPTISGITIDTSTALRPVIRISDTKTVGTYYETLTVSDSAGAVVTTPITIVVVPPPSFSATSEQVDSGTVLYLDAANSASYPKSGNTWSDLSGRNLAATLNYNTGTSSVNANGTTRSNTTYLSSVSCVAPTFGSDGIGSLTFDGSSSCSYVPNLGFISNYTYEVWLKRNGAQSTSSVIITTPYRFANDQIFISLQWSGATTLVAAIFNGITSPSGWYSTGAATIPDLTWVHAAVTYNGTTLSLIINGETTTTATPTVTWNSAVIDNGLLLGRKWDGAATFKGSIGSIRIYDRVLTLSEIQQNYNATKARFLATSNKVSPTKRYGTLTPETYTVTSGAGVISVALASNQQSALRWDTSTARSIKLSAQESLTVGNYLETITVTDAVGQSSYLALRYTVTQADTLTISMDTATVITFNGAPITVYPKPYFKGLAGFDTLTVTTKFSSSTYTLSASAPTNADTYTVIAADPVFTSGASTNYLAVLYETSTAVVNKAPQLALNPSMYGATIGSPFTITLLGGSGDGAVSETLTGTSTAPNCAISAHVLTSTASVISYCTVKITKAASTNYLIESVTVQIYFMSYVINQPSGQTGGGTSIAINGETSITRSSGAPSITSVGTSGDMTYPIAINGVGFSGSSAALTTVKFWRNVLVNSPDFIIKSDTLIWSKQPAGATAGRLIVVNDNGTAASPDIFTPLVFSI